MAKINTMDSTDFLAKISAIVAEVTIGKRAEDGDAKTFQVNVAEMHFAALEKVIRYGVQRAVNDPIGGKDKTLADKFEAAEDIILSWYTGEMKIRKNAAPTLTAKEAFAADFFKKQIKKNTNAAEWKANYTPENGVKWLAEKIAALPATMTKHMEAAYALELEMAADMTTVKDSPEVEAATSEL